MPEEKTCFIIMPITTPENYIEKYRDGKEHFDHVLETFLKPSVIKAGYKPIPPITEGADIIQANIINNLETANLVLCDMSCFNPNVFFEYGIRTALNKPVCIVKDELVAKIPFDTSIVNCHQYKKDLNSWDTDVEIEKLKTHIIKSAEKSKTDNLLWKYFGLKKEAEPFTDDDKPGADKRLDYMAMQIDSIKDNLEKLMNQKAKPIITSKDDRFDDNVSINKIKHYINDIMPKSNKAEFISFKNKKLFVLYSGPEMPSFENDTIITDFENTFDKHIEFVNFERQSTND